MTSSQDMIRGRSNVMTLTNNSGGALVAGDVCIQDTTGDEYVTTTTSANSTAKVFIAAEPIANGATGKFYAGGYCPLVTPSASVTRGRYLFTHTVAKQAAENATYGAGAFGVILESGTTPSVWLFGETNQGGGGVSRSGSTTDEHLAVWNGSDADSIKDGGVVPSGGDIFGFGTLTQPIALASWTADNIETYFVTTESNGVIHFSCTLESGDQIRGYHRNYPATPKVTAAFIAQPYQNQYDQVGIYVSDGTKFKMFSNDGLGILRVNYFTNTTTLSTEAIMGPNAALHYKAPLIWWQYEEDVTNRYIRVSVNGVYWITYLQEDKTTSLTGTTIGFGAYVAVAGANSSPGAIGTLVHWLEE